MKLAKKIMALSLAAVMAGSCLTACGDSSKADGKGGDENTLVIGGSGPLTGDAAQYGVGVKNAAQLAVDEINDAGGVNGVKFKLVFEDDEAGKISDNSKKIIRKMLETLDAAYDTEEYKDFKIFPVKTESPEDK